MENITVADIHGVVYQGRTVDMDPNKARYAQTRRREPWARSSPGRMSSSAFRRGGVLKPEMVKDMARQAADPRAGQSDAEILPEDAKAVRPDCVTATGRSDYPNQVNNVLCFPFIFRGALDVGATTINEEMKLATVHAIAELAHAEQSDIVATAYGEKGSSFGPEYLDPEAVRPAPDRHNRARRCRAAMESGVGRGRSSTAMPIVTASPVRVPVRRLHEDGVRRRDKTPKRVAYAEGENERVLRAVQVVIDEKLAHPILIGRPDKIQQRVESFGLRIRDGVNCEFVNIDADPRYHDTWTEYYRLTRRRGVSYEDARDEVRRRDTLIAAMLVHRGDVDAMLCGTVGATRRTCATSRTSSDCARARAPLPHEHAHVAGAHGVPLRHAGEPGPYAAAARGDRAASPSSR